MTTNTDKSAQLETALEGLQRATAGLSTALASVVESFAAIAEMLKPPSLLRDLVSARRFTFACIDDSTIEIALPLGHVLRVWGIQNEHWLDADLGEITQREIMYLCHDQHYPNRYISHD